MKRRRERIRFTWLLQSIVLLLNQTPLSRVFSRLYDIGVERVVSALARNTAVLCILGSGSYFEKRATPGLSDVDLIVVLKDTVIRTDPVVEQIAHTYERVHRFFPFLGRWREKEANLIFLSDLAAGFPAPESFRSRFKQGRLLPLYGSLPDGIVTGLMTTSESLTEINTLLRFALMADSQTVRRLVFWKRIFTKLCGLAEQLSLTDLSEEIRGRADLSFLREDDTPLFFTKADPAGLFSLQLFLTRRICDAVAAREPKVKIRPLTSAEPQAPYPAPIPFSAAFDPPNRHQFTIRTVPSVPLGWVPSLLYFSIDEPIPLIEFHGNTYEILQDLRRTDQRQPPLEDEAALVSADGFLFLLNRRPDLVEVSVLDPLQFANVYAAAFGGSLEFEILATILSEQTTTADAVFRGYGHLYRTREGVISKVPYPCIYREHDAEVIEAAVRLLRVRFASEPPYRLIQSSRHLFDYLREIYPDCEYFLTGLQRYQRFLYSDSSMGRPTANNLDRCLHQFMAQALTHGEMISITSIQKHLGITVGVITRNRAKDLKVMLDSLTRQLRQPDEVLVVDNGSTDQTKAVLETFRERLPIRYEFLERPNIPGARNRVLESAAHEIVSFIDDDCVSEPQWLAAVETGFLRANNIGILGGWVTHEPGPVRSTVENYYRAFHHLKS